MNREETQFPLEFHERMKRHLSGAVRLGAGSSRGRSLHLTFCHQLKSPQGERNHQTFFCVFSAFSFSLFLQQISQWPHPQGQSPLAHLCWCFTPYLQEDGFPWSWGCPASGFSPQAGALWSGCASSSASGSCFVSVSVTSA